MTETDLIASGYAGLFLTAFLAATLVPLSSEAVLAAMGHAEGFDLTLLFALATLGNTLGAVANWALGRFCLRWAGRRRFPFSREQLTRASERFGKYGVWSLLFAWVPIIGDPLTFAAGVLRVPFVPFVILTGIGKGARYAAVILLTGPALPL